MLVGHFFFFHLHLHIFHANTEHRQQVHVKNQFPQNETFHVQPTVDYYDEYVHDEQFQNERWNSIYRHGLCGGL